MFSKYLVRCLFTIALISLCQGADQISQNIRNRIEQYQNKLTTKCYQLKIPRTTDEDYEEVIRKFHESEIEQPVLDEIELIEGQLRTLDLWEILQSVNPSHSMKYGRDDLSKPDSTLLDNKKDMLFKRSIVLCGMFENLMRTLGWRVGDTLDIEEDICDVVGQLLMRVEEQDRSSLLDCMQSAMMNIQVEDSTQDDDKLRTLLITKKKYNGSNLACILLEQMILDNKDNNVSWKRIVCAQFIDLVVPLIIESDFRGDVHWTLTSLLKLETKWKVADVYNVMRNGLLMFHDNQKEFHRYLMIIRDFAVYPSLNISPTIELKDILYSHDENTWRCLDGVVREKETEKSVDQVLKKLKEDEIGQAEKDTIQQIIAKLHTMLNNYSDVREYPNIIERELDRIRKSEQKYGVDVLSSCLAVTSMALHICKGYWPLNTQLVSYCLLVVQNKQGRLLEILTGEGKSCVIAMVAATSALQGRTVDIVTSSPVLSQRDADEWREFYSLMKLDVGCNVEDNTKEDTTCYECPIVYGTVETFARDILKTEFLLQDVRKGRKCDIVIVDEVDSMLIDQGVQCTYLSHDVASVGLCHFELILAMIWMHVSRLEPYINKDGILFYKTEPELFLVVLSSLSNEIDPLHMLRMAEEDEEVPGIKKGFTDEYLSKDLEGQTEMLESVEAFTFLMFVRKILHLDIDIYRHSFISNVDQRIDRSRISIVSLNDGLASVILHGDMIKDRLTKMITYENETKIDLPIHLKDYCKSRLQCWFDNAFLAKDMQPGREYIVQDDAIYPVDYKFTGVIEYKKKWGDGLQQFLEIKHGWTCSPLSLITNYLSNIDFLDRYGSNIVGVSGTLGDDQEKQFMRDTFSVEFAAIPTSKRRKLLELDGLILDNYSIWLDVVSKTVESTADQRAVLVICEDIATAEQTYEVISTRAIEVILYSRIKSERDRMNKVLKTGDIVITTNLGARGTDFVTDDVVNKNGGLFVLVTFIPLNDRVEKQAFGRTGRKGATGSCQIIVNRETMPEWSRQCETVDEVRRLRDSIERHRLDKNNTTEVTWIRCKQNLFREYCKFKNEFFTSNASESNDSKIQTEILDETWAKWIQQYKTIDQDSNPVEELRQILEDCSKRATNFGYDNIYHILKFGSVRLMKEAFKEAADFYDRVIRMDPEWSAFAHYNRAYCTIQMKGDGYIQHAINDLNAALRKLEKYKTNCLLSQFIIKRKNKMDWMSKDRESEISAQYYIMIECQFLHHIATQINETIDKMRKIDTIYGTVKTFRRNILELIPGADSWMEQILQKYRQLGLLFTYNIDVEPQFCYRSQIVSSLVMLESVAQIILMVFPIGILVNVRSMKLKDTIDVACSRAATCDESFGWMSQCASRAIITGIKSIEFMRHVSSKLVPIKSTELGSSYKMTKETSQFTKLTNSQVQNVLKLLNSLKPKINKLVSCQVDEILLHMTNVTMGALREKIKHKKIALGQNLHLKLCSVYNNVTSLSRSDREQFVDCIRDLAKFLASPSQLSDADFHTDELQNIALKLMSMSRIENITATDLESFTHEITTAASKIEIGTVMTKFSDSLCDMMNVFSQNSTTDGDVCDDVQMLEMTNEVLTSAWSEIIRGTLQNRIVRSLMIDIVRENTKELLKLREMVGFNKGMLSIESNLIRMGTRTPFVKSFFKIHQPNEEVTWFTRAIKS